jgi:hypothetical protein
MGFLSSVDNDEPWYDDTDEETFRPWLSEIPVAADEMYLVACEFMMADGSRYRVLRHLHWKQERWV